MWGRAGSAIGSDAGASRSRAWHPLADGAAMYGPAPSTANRSKEIGELRSMRSRLIDLGNRARMLRQRKRASLIDTTLRQITMELLRHETGREG